MTWELLTIGGDWMRVIQDEYDAETMVRIQDCVRRGTARNLVVLTW